MCKHRKSWADIRMEHTNRIKRSIGRSLQKFSKNPFLMRNWALECAPWSGGFHNLLRRAGRVVLDLCLYAARTIHRAGILRRNISPRLEHQFRRSREDDL